MFDPLHHGKQDIVLRISEPGYAVDAWVQNLATTSEVPRGETWREVSAAVTDG